MINFILNNKKYIKGFDDKTIFISSKESITKDFLKSLPKITLTKIKRYIELNKIINPSVWDD
jgi:hypothetical protein